MHLLLEWLQALVSLDFLAAFFVFSSPELDDLSKDVDGSGFSLEGSTAPVGDLHNLKVNKCYRT